jgi:hypothetical protein
MKFRKIVVLLLLIFSFSSSHAQTTKGEAVVGANFGYSLFINAMEIALNEFDDVVTTSTPALGLSYDRSVTDNFSVGLIFSLQTLNANFKDTYIDINDELAIDLVRVDLKRINFAIRPLIHYGSNESLDLYSGLRIGFTSFSSKYESNQEDFGINKLGGTRVSTGLVVFGMRYYLGEKVGLNFDFQIGAPYLVSGGVAARF